MEKKKVIIPIVAGLAIIGITAGLSFAYFSATVTNDNQTETKLKSNTLGLEYTGVTDINVTDIVPGDYMTKTFTVKNTSNRAVDYNIYMENITNEFNEDLVYTLKDGDTEVVSETPLPETSDKDYLLTNISIAKDETKTYTLTIKFLYKADEAQNDMQGKEFKATLGVDTEIIDYSIYSVSGKTTTEKGVDAQGYLVFYSEKQQVSLSNGEFSVSNLEKGKHEIYYIGIDTSTMTKDEIKEQAVCKGTFTVPEFNVSNLECKNETSLIFSDISVNKTNPYVYEYDFTGTEQVLTIAKSGTYLLETWGAKAGSLDDTFNDGYGSYLNGTINLSKGTKIYINVGEKGKNNSERVYPENSNYTWTHCGIEGYGDCSISGFSLVKYGANNNWYYVVSNNQTVKCSSSIFVGPDPAPGIRKYCYSTPITEEEYKNFTTNKSYNDWVSHIAYISGTINEIENENILLAASGSINYYATNSNMKDLNLSCYNCSLESNSNINVSIVNDKSELAVDNVPKDGNGYVRISLVK